VPYEGNHPYPEEKTLAQLQNRWDRHVSICKQCQQVSRRCPAPMLHFSAVHASAVLVRRKVKSALASPSELHVLSGD